MSNSIWNPTSMIIDQTGRHKVLLPINHNQYNFRETKCILLLQKAFFKISIVQNQGKYHLQRYLLSKFFNFEKYSDW